MTTALPPVQKKRRLSISGWLARLIGGGLIVASVFGVIQTARETSPQSPQPAFIVSTETPYLALRGTETPTFTLLPTLTFTPPLTLTPTIFFTPTVTLPAISPASCVDPAAPRQVGVVTKIVDGDTIHVTIDGQDYPVRYIGMDTPETGVTGAAPATAYNSDLVMGKTVTLVKDVSEVDRYDRLLRYVFVGNTFVNYELVAKGLASAGTWKPDTACDAVLHNVQTLAMVASLGLWEPTVVPIVVPIVVPLPINPTEEPIIEPTAGNCDPSYPTVCIPPPPPDLNCKDIPYRRFKVLPPDPHHFDSDHDGVGCES